MKKYWLLDEKVVCFKDDSIYTGDLKPENQQSLIGDLDKGLIPENFFRLRYSYIVTVENPKGKNALIIKYGTDSPQKLIINNEVLKGEVFGFIKNELSSFEYSQKMPSFFSHAKTQLFAIIIPSFLFAWTLYLALRIESGIEYEIVGGGVPGITSVILSIAQFGSIKIIIGYSILLLIAGYAFIRKLKTRSLTEYLKRV